MMPSRPDGKSSRGRGGCEGSGEGALHDQGYTHYLGMLAKSGNCYCTTYCDEDVDSVVHGVMCISNSPHRLASLCLSARSARPERSSCRKIGRTSASFQPSLSSDNLEEDHGEQHPEAILGQRDCEPIYALLDGLMKALDMVSAASSRQVS